MGPPYIERLSFELDNINWSLCQLHIRSSYMGYGTGSLSRDFEDIASSIAYLYSIGKCTIVIMGHSTGAQDAIYYALNQNSASSFPHVHGIIVSSLSARQELIV